MGQTASLLSGLSVKADKTSAEFVTSQTWLIVDLKGPRFVGLWVRNRSPSHPKPHANIGIPRFQRRVFVFSATWPRQWRCQPLSSSPLRVFCTQDSLCLHWKSAPCPLPGWCFDAVVIASSDSGMRSRSRHAAAPPPLHLWLFWFTNIKPCSV